MLKQESIGLNVSVSTKEEAIDKLVDLMAAGGRLKDKAGYKEGILAREALGSTGIGGGIAIPHAKVEAVKEPGLAAMVVPAGVDYEAFDGSLANILFMIAAPAEGADGAFWERHFPRTFHTADESGLHGRTVKGGIQGGLFKGD